MSRKIDEETNDYVKSKLKEIKVKNKIPSPLKKNENNNQFTLNKFAKFMELKLANWIAPEVINPKMAVFSTTFSLSIFVIFQLLDDGRYLMSQSEGIPTLIAAVVILICGVIILFLPGLDFTQEYEKFLDEKYNIKK